LNFNSTISNPSSWINSNKELLGLNWSSNSVSDHFKNKNCRNIFLQDNDIPIGVLLGHFLYEDQRTIEFEILHIAIIPDSRNQGFGYELLLELEKQLKKPNKINKNFPRSEFWK